MYNRIITEENGEVGILRYFHNFNQIFKLIKKCIICLKEDLYFKSFANLIRQGKIAKLTMENNHVELSWHNFSLLFNEILKIYNPLKKSLSPQKVINY